jgi:hypothetical protein
MQNEKYIKNMKGVNYFLNNQNKKRTCAYGVRPTCMELKKS